MKKTAKKYQVISPDGFTIEMIPYYRSMKKAMQAFDLFIKKYENQGYYSSINYGRIPLDHLTDYCTFRTL